MKIIIPYDLDDSPDNEYLQAGTWSAKPQEITVGYGRNQRKMPGYRISRHFPGVGWVVSNLERHVWDGMVADGHIRIMENELSEADAEVEIMLHIQRERRER